MGSISVPGGPAIKPRKTLKDIRIPTAREGLEICCTLSGAMQKIYPGHAWQVEMNQEIVTFKAMNLHMRMGINMPVANIDPTGRILVDIGGEILERFGCPRGARNIEFERTLPRDVMGNVIPVDERLKHFVTTGLKRYGFHKALLNG